MTQTALILGASRGLGLALAEELLHRGWAVIGTVRGGGTKLHELNGDGRLTVETLEITDPDSLAALRHRLDGRKIDLLYVNAGISNGQADRIAQTSTEEFTKILLTNTLSPMRAVEAFESLVPPDGTIAVMSSGLGSVANNTAGGWETYRASKAALNTLMRSFAADHPNDTRTLLVTAPGWVRTDMGGAGATLSIEESIPRLTDTVLSQHGKAGLQYLDYRGQTVPW